MSTFLSTILHGLVMFVLAKLFPLRSNKAISSLSPAELRSRFMPDDFKMLGLGWLAIICCTSLTFVMLKGLIYLNASFQADALILIQPSIYAFLVCSFFSGLFFSIPLYLAIGKTRLKEQWVDFLAYQDLKYKLDFRRAMVLMAWIVGLMSTVGTFMMLDSYTAIAENEIRYNRIFGIGADTYSYGQVTAINEVDKLEAPNGNIVEDRHFVIHFNDGKRWVSRQEGFSNYTKDLTVAQLIAEKAGLPIQKLEFDTP